MSYNTTVYVLHEFKDGRRSILQWTEPPDCAIRLNRTGLPFDEDMMTFPYVFPLTVSMSISNAIMFEVNSSLFGCHWVLNPVL